MIPAGNGGGYQSHTESWLPTSSTPNFSPVFKHHLNHFGSSLQTEFVFCFNIGLHALNSSFLFSVLGIYVCPLHIFVSSEKYWHKYIFTYICVCICFYINKYYVCVYIQILNILNIFLYIVNSFSFTQFFPKLYCTIIKL